MILQRNKKADNIWLVQNLRIILCRPLNPARPVVHYFHPFLTDQVVLRIKAIKLAMMCRNYLHHLSGLVVLPAA